MSQRMPNYAMTIDIKLIDKNRATVASSIQTDIERLCEHKFA